MNWPAEFVSMYQTVFGVEAWQHYVDQAKEAPLRGLRVNTLRPAVESLRSAASVEPVPWWNDAGLIAPNIAAGKDPFHAAGAYYLQEPSAMSPVAALAPMPGERILDLCAAPGGKATQIAQRLAGQGLLVANDPVRERCDALAENVERLGIVNACVTQLSPERVAGAYPGYFDAILVDAPCSGEGMFRREPAALQQWHAGYPAACAKRQLEILESALTSLRPGGRLVYSTCTLNPLENEWVCAELLARHPDLDLAELTLPGTEPGLTHAVLADVLPKLPWLGYTAMMVSVAPGSTATGSAPPALERTRRIMPHGELGEGHFFACFTRSDSATDRATDRATDDSHNFRRQSVTVATRAGSDPRAREFIAAWEAFCVENLSASEKWALSDAPTLLLSGVTLLAAADHRAPAHGVLRNGLPLLTRPYRQFMPTHALAHTLPPARRTLRLKYGDKAALAYLRGEELTLEPGEDGWTLVLIDGLPLGWGKAVAGKLKNHYPKGLRGEHAFAWQDKGAKERESAGTQAFHPKTTCNLSDKMRD
ncbi:MAG: SAM-dependent methyltransferase [Firmicutes bacterium]|nr:SAM-dependent methyltransferase [Bacillota bacterium]